MSIRIQIINGEFAHFQKFLRQCRWSHIDAGLVANMQMPLQPAERERVDRAAAEGGLPFPEEQPGGDRQQDKEVQT